jgi:hypothetical protein
MFRSALNIQANEGLHYTVSSYYKLHTYSLKTNILIFKIADCSVGYYCYYVYVTNCFVTHCNSTPSFVFISWGVLLGLCYLSAASTASIFLLTFIWRE